MLFICYPMLTLQPGVFADGRGVTLSSSASITVIRLDRLRLLGGDTDARSILERSTKNLKALQSFISLAYRSISYERLYNIVGDSDSDEGIGFERSQIKCQQFHLRFSISSTIRVLIDCSKLPISIWVCF